MYRPIVGGFRGQALFTRYYVGVTLVGFKSKSLSVVCWFPVRGGKFPFGIWVHTAWKRLQSTLHQWGQLTLHTEPGLHIRAPTHTQWHSLGPFNQSEPSGVGPPWSGWESCWNTSLSQDRQVWVGGLGNFYAFSHFFLFINLVHFDFFHL